MQILLTVGATLAISGMGATPVIKSQLDKKVEKKAEEIIYLHGPGWPALEAEIKAILGEHQ